MLRTINDSKTAQNLTNLEILGRCLLISHVYKTLCFLFEAFRQIAAITYFTLKFNTPRKLAKQSE